jgi:hypothetical protein
MSTDSPCFSAATCWPSTSTPSRRNMPPPSWGRSTRILVTTGERNAASKRARPPSREPAPLSVSHGPPSGRCPERPLRNARRPRTVADDLRMESSPQVAPDVVGLPPDDAARACLALDLDFSIDNRWQVHWWRWDEPGARVVEQWPQPGSPTNAVRVLVGSAVVLMALACGSLGAACRPCGHEAPGRGKKQTPRLNQDVSSSDPP